jgi:hypothetical protein
LLAQRRDGRHDEEVVDVLGLEAEGLWIQVRVAVLFRLGVAPGI